MASRATAFGGTTSDGRANYVLAMLTFAYAMAYVDRQLLNLLVDPIKHTLEISDTRFSLLQGTAFVVAYLAAAPVFGRLVDVASRKYILVFGVCAWSLFTTASGFCSSFEGLFLARMGVGITEACIFPVAWSLIGDCFSKERTPRALSIFAISPQLGGGFSLIAGGLVVGFAGSLAAKGSALGGFEPWQLAFVIVGLPGILFAGLLLATLREPARKGSAAGASDVPGGASLPLSQVGTELWQSKSFYGRLLAANGMLAIVQLAIPFWLPAFMIRAHGLSMAETGLNIGIISVLVGPVATLSGPFVAAWMKRRGYADANLRAVGLCALPMLVAVVALPMMPSTRTALAMAGAAIFLTGFPAGLLQAATQMATPSRMQGVMGSLYTFSAQLIGYMVGPTLVALLTDNVFGDPAMVGRSMQIVMGTAAALLGLLVASVIGQYRRRMAGQA